MTEIFTKFFSYFDIPNSELIPMIRNIIRNNGLPYMNLSVITDQAYLPKALVELGIFESLSDVRRKNKNLLIDIPWGERVKVGKINLFFRSLHGLG